MAQDLPENAIAIMELPLFSGQPVELIVIGGGAAGFFGAIAAAESGVAPVVLLEATSQTLQKVRISGGGRCNVTNACWDLKDLALNYPRGRIELLGSFSRFSTVEAVNWFEMKGLDLIEEEDGRIFPVSNTSLDVITCLRNSAKSFGVYSMINSKVTKLEKQADFHVHLKNGEIILAKKILFATGGDRSSYKLIEQLGHKIIKPVPSLFSFKLNSPFLSACSGISLDNIQLELQCNKKKFVEKGRIVITHWGISGPAVLKLSAFAARELNEDNYKAVLTINWCNMNITSVNKIFQKHRYMSARNFLKTIKPIDSMPRSLWLLILEEIGIDPLIKWANLTAKDEAKIIGSLVSSRYCVTGRGPFKDEFVIAGGVDLKEVNLKNMESLICSGLYFAGEVLNVDGITGGFNFQHCWTSAWLAGNAIASSFGCSL